MKPASAGVMGGNPSATWTDSLPKILLFIDKDRFNGRLKETGQLESQRKARVKFPRLDGVDGLARDLQPIGEIGLRPVSLGTKNTQSVLHL